MSKIQDIIDVVDGSIETNNMLTKYHIARAIRDANRRKTLEAKFNAVLCAVERTCLFPKAVNGAITITNPVTTASYTL